MHTSSALQIRYAFLLFFVAKMTEFCLCLNNIKQLDTNYSRLGPKPCAAERLFAYWNPPFQSFFKRLSISLIYESSTGKQQFY